MSGKAKNNKVSKLKPKDAERGNPNCSFCGVHKDDVPLVVTSSVTKANICNLCALTIVNQTMKITQQIAQTNIQLKKERYQLAEKLDSLIGEHSKVIMPDKKQDAIDTANATDVGDE